MKHGDLFASGKKNLPLPWIMQKTGQISGVRTADTKLSLVDLYNDDPTSWAPLCPVNKAFRGTTDIFFGKDFETIIFNAFLLISTKEKEMNSHMETGKFLFSFCFSIKFKYKIICSLDTQMKLITSK